MRSIILVKHQEKLVDTMGSYESIASKFIYLKLIHLINLRIHEVDSLIASTIYHLIIKKIEFVSDIPQDEVLRVNNYLINDKYQYNENSMFPQKMS